MSAPISLRIADPQEIIRLGLRAMVAGSGIKIIDEATDTKSTLALAKKHKPAVVLLDVAIPGGDPFELVAILAKSLTGTKCILFTAIDNPTSMARARAVGAAHCLLKRT